MKVGSLITGIFHAIGLALCVVVYFILGLFISMAQEIGSANGAEVTGLPGAVYFLFAVLSGILVVLTIVACILVMKKIKVARIMFLISFALCLIMTLVTAFSVEITDGGVEGVLGVFCLVAPVLFGALATVFAFVAKNSIQKPKEVTENTTYEAGE